MKLSATCGKGDTVWTELEMQCKLAQMDIFGLHRVFQYRVGRQSSFDKELPSWFETEGFQAWCCRGRFKFCCTRLKRATRRCLKIARAYWAAFSFAWQRGGCLSKEVSLLSPVTPWPPLGAAPGKRNAKPESATCRYALELVRVLDFSSPR